jgi:hypothetical protein
MGVERHQEVVEKPAYDATQTIDGSVFGKGFK